MLATDPADLDLIREAFSFLLTMGFKEIGATDWQGRGGILTYASPKVRVQVILARPDCEADVTLALAGAADSFSLRCFAGLAPNEALPPPVMFCRGAEQSALESLAQLTQQYAAKALQGDDASFEQARQPVPPLTFSDFVKRTEKKQR